MAAVAHQGRIQLLHTYIHTYVHTYIHTYIHTYMHAYIHTYICLIRQCTYAHLDAHAIPSHICYYVSVAVFSHAIFFQSDYVIGFESVCSARIRQFDESESEVDEERGLSGDPWSDKDILMNSTFDRNSR